MSEACGCKIDQGHNPDGGGMWIVYCPLHASAPALQRQRDALLEAAQAVEKTVSCRGNDFECAEVMTNLRAVIQQCEGRAGK